MLDAKHAQFREQISTLCAVIALAIVFGLMTPRLLKAPVYAYDEGIVLTYSDLWARGWLPNRDFFSNYPPGNYWIVGSAFTMLGSSVDAERTIGMAYRLLLASSVFILSWPRGNAIAFLAAAISFFAATKDGVAAYAWVGACAVSLASITILVIQMNRRNLRLRWILAAMAGFLAAMTALLRVDMPAVGVLIASSVLFWNLNRREKSAYCIAWLFGICPLVIHACRVGWARLFDDLIYEPIFKIGPHREMPIPPIDHEAQLIFYVTVATGAIIVLTAMLRFCWPDRSRKDLAFTSVAMLILCLTPHVLARADVAHCMYVGLLAYAFTPFAISLLIGRIGFSNKSTSTQLISCAAIVVLLYVGARCSLPFAERSTDSFLHIVTLHNDPNALVGNRGRVLPLYRQTDSRIVKNLLKLIEQSSKPGDRIFIGVGDQRYANMNDVDLYFLLPQLLPVTHHIQLDPGATNTSDSTLPGEIATADLVVLNVEESDPGIPDSGGEGSNNANAVIKTDFILKATLGPYQLFVRAKPKAVLDVGK